MMDASALLPFLTCYQAYPRYAVDQFVAEELRQLRLYEVEVPRNPDRLARICNHSALLASSVGRHDLADELCRRQTAHFYRLFSGGFCGLELVIQPWINIGRLKAMDGNYREAVEIFSLYRFARQRADVEVGEVIVRAGDWERFEGDHPDLLPTLAAMCLVEAGAVLLRLGETGQFDALLNYYREDQVGGSLVTLVEMASARKALSGQTLDERARQGLSAHPANAFGAGLALSHSVVAALAGGRSAEARSLSKELATSFEGREIGADPAAEANFARRVVSLSLEAEGEISTATARRALSLTRSVGDEVLMARLLKLLESGGVSDHVLEESRAWIEHSAYPGRGAAAGLSAQAALDGLLARLGEFLEA